MYLVSYELEIENQLSFLDVLLVRTRKNIKTKVYRKPTNSEIFFD